MPQITPTLNLLFPQWQGASRPELRDGALLLHRLIQADPKLARDFKPIMTPATYSLSLDQGILGYAQILAQLTQACDVIQTHASERILTLGGDCGVEIAPISFLNGIYENMTVIWLDAHGDLNTPDSSPSAHFHGMPLRTLLGDGDEAIVRSAFSTLDPSQVCLVGSREFDLPEQEFVKTHDLFRLSVEQVEQGSYQLLFDVLSQRNCHHLYIHLDLDVLDPKMFPHLACPTPSGLSVKALSQLLMALSNRYQVIGFSLLEFLPTTPNAAKDAMQILRLLNCIGQD